MEFIKGRKGVLEAGQPKQREREKERREGCVVSESIERRERGEQRRWRVERMER